MIALLDANLLIALFDPAHVNHALAHTWLSANRSSGWATCPLTQNACLRILSHLNYPAHLEIADIARRLSNAIGARPTMCSGRTRFLCVMPTVFASIKF